MLQEANLQIAGGKCTGFWYGVMSGGYGEQELSQAGAYRVYRDPAELLESIYQLGLRGA